MISKTGKVNDFNRTNGLVDHSAVIIYCFCKQTQIEIPKFMEKPRITQNLQSEFSFQLREPEKFPFKTTSSKLELLSETQFICVAQKTF